MNRSVLALAAGLLAAPALFVPAKADEPLCFGLAATIPDHTGEIVGTPGDDVIVGDDARNVVYGEGGNDSVCLLGGDDRFDSPCCDDEGAIRLDAGEGDDEVYARTNGTAEVFGGDGDDLLSTDTFTKSVIQGGDGDDVIDASDLDDDIDGGDGNDFVVGRDGDDAIDGGAGADEIYGDEGFDSIDGGTSTHPEKQRIRKGKRPNGKPKYVTKIVQVEDADLCQVGPGGGTATNCEREV